MQLRKYGFLVFLLTGMLLLSGCGSGDGDRFGVSGEIKFKGDPLDQGTIQFESKDKKHAGGATIKNGKYSIPEEKGLPPGVYIVRITSAAGGQVTGLPGESDVIPKERIPAEYNTNSNLKFEVTADGPNVFNRDIP